MLNTESPAQHYSRNLSDGKIQADKAQEQAIRELELIYQQLLNYWQPQPGLLGGLFGKPKLSVPGLYLWGGVGRGKTYLMDVFFHCLPGERKLRMHFHRFMQMVHRSLNAHEGKKNPLQLVANEISAKADVLCFDEFFVSDIGDAMILANLLHALFENGLVLVTTSNLVPSKLYERGLQREKFLPAITLLEENTQVLNVDGGTDYRLRALENADVYITPLGKEADSTLLGCFNELTRGMHAQANLVLEILGRDITARYWSEGVAWFEFSALCDGPRSAADYIEISQLFHTVLISDVPGFDEASDDLARRFITLVDEFYDQKVKLILSAANPLETLYIGSELSFPFERTQSRLLEMQSLEYLGLEHHQGG